MARPSRTARPVLWGLARLGALDPAAATLFAQYGPTGHPPHPWMFSHPPASADWTVQLGGQTRIAVHPLDALREVRQAWTAAVGTLEV